MTTTAEQLDLSRLPAFTLAPSDFAVEYAALKVRIAARFAEAGVAYELGTIETDSSRLVAREFAYQKTLILDALNNAGRGLTLSYGVGTQLDHIAASYYADLHIRRLALVDAPRPYETNPEDWESDERFKLRLSLCAEARTPGTLAYYELAALTAAPFLADALALNHSSGLVDPGEILVVLLGLDPVENATPEAKLREEPAQILLAQAALLDRASKLATDSVRVRAARRVPVARSYALGLRRGPDPALVVAAALTAYGTYSAARRRIGKLLAEAGEKAALMSSGAEFVRPVAGAGGVDVDPGIDGVVVPTLTLAVEAVG